MADEAKRQAQLEAGRKKLETFKARKSLLKQQQQQQQQQQKEKEKKEEGETTIQTTTTPKRDEIFEQQQQHEEFHTPNALVSSSSTSTCDDSKTKATTTMVMQDEIEKIVREAVEKESAKLKRKFEEDVDELKQKHEEAREETEKEKKEFEDLKMEEMRKRMEEEKENFQTQSTERINELQEKVQKAVKKGKSMQAERDEIKSAFDALTTQSEELVKTIEIANERSGNAEKELGETKIQLQAKEKEFADLKSFYEENNASNLNEEERLKLELIETKTTLGEANEKIAQLELDARTVSNERYDLIAQIDQYKKQMGDLEKSFDAHKSDEDSLREEKATFLGKINALESERGELFARNEKILNDLEEMTKLKNAQSEKVQKAVKKGKSIQADLVETKKTLGAKEQEVIDLQQRVDALVNAEPTTPQQQQEEEGKYVALLAEKDATIASVLEREAKASAHVETIQKQVDDLIVESNASADKVASIENELAHSREAVANAEREIGETKIQLQAKEKEFADLKSFYEENNASNLNEEERLKMELNEANANMQLVREEVETLKKKLTEQDERSLAAANEQHSEQIQLLQATIAEARDEGNRERVVAESLKQELDAKVSEVQKMKIEIEHSAEKLEEINAEKEMFMSECEKALESFDREKAKAKELKQKLKDFDHESKTSAQMKMEEHENALRAASERATFLEEELSKANAALTQASENVQRGPSAEELEREKQEQQRELHELKSRLDQELQGMNVLREQLQEERGKRAQLDARLAASLAAQQQQQATTTQHTGASEQKQPSPHHRFTNKKNEDYGDDDDETMLNDIEGAIISGGSYSFVPLQGKFKSLTFCPPLQSSGCLQAANMFDRFSVFLQRRPTLRVLLIGYFALLHVLLFLF